MLTDQEAIQTFDPMWDQLRNNQASLARAVDAAWAKKSTAWQHAVIFRGSPDFLKTFTTHSDEADRWEAAVKRGIELRDRCSRFLFTEIPEEPVAAWHPTYRASKWYDINDLLEDIRSYYRTVYGYGDALTDAVEEGSYGDG